MKGTTKKLYQNVSISKPKRFGNQNTNSINVIVNPNDDDEEEKQMKMNPSLTSQLNALGKQGMSPMEMNYIQQEALRNDKPIDGESINESNQKLKDEEDLRTLQQGALEQIQEGVMQGQSDDILGALSRLQSDVLNNVRYQVEKEEARGVHDEAMNQVMSMLERQNAVDTEQFEGEQARMRAELIDQQENTRLENENMMSREREAIEEREEDMLELRGLEDEVQRLVGMFESHLTGEAEEFTTPDQLTPPPQTPQYASPLMETFEQMKRDRTPEVRKRLATRAPKGKGKQSQSDLKDTQDYLTNQNY